MRYKTIGLGVVLLMLGDPWPDLHFPGLIVILDMEPLLYFTWCAAYVSTIAIWIGLEQRARRAEAARRATQ